MTPAPPASAPERLAERVPERVPERLPERLPERVAKRLPERLPEHQPDRLPERLPERVAKRPPERLPEHQPDRLPERLPERVAKRPPERLPERLPERPPERLPERVAKRPPERLPERLPERAAGRLAERGAERLAERLAGRLAGRAAVAILVAGALVRLALAAWLPPGLDESYALAVARDFPLSFYDHPPLGFWLGAALPAATGIEHPLAARLPFVVLGTLTGVAVWRLGAALGGPNAGLWAVALYTVAPHMAVGSGAFVLPDAPLNAALAWMAVVLAPHAARAAPPPLRVWLAAGALLAVALASKYQAVLAALAIFLWMAADPARRRWLATPGPWAGAAIGALGALPALVWNVQHDWASFAFHGERTGQPPDPGNLAMMTLGQLGYLLPPVAVLAVLGLARAARPGAAGAARMLLWLAALPVGVFAVVYLFGRYTFPHWPMQGWLMALPLAAAWAAAAAARPQARARAWTLGVAAFAWTLLAAAALHLPTGILTRALASAPAWDRGTSGFDWRPLGARLAAEGWLDGAAGLVAPGWIDAGLMATALAAALPAQRLPVRVPGGPPTAHHFAFLPGAEVAGPLLYLAPGPVADGAVRLAAGRALAAAHGATILREGIIVLPRGGRPHASVAVLRLDWPALARPSLARRTDPGSPAPP